MASGSIVGQVSYISPPAANFGTLTRRAGGSTPAENALVYAFDAATIEYLDFLVYLSGYAAGGLTVTLLWSAASATSGVTRWGVAVRRLQDDAEDIDTAQTYDYNALDATAASASGEPVYDTLTFTDGADMDSWANNEFAIVRVRREANHANDTMTGDAELWAIVIKET